MASKASKPEGGDEAQIVETIRGSMQQIWQAGLGAFLRAQKEGNAVFQELVQEGEKLQSRTRAVAGERLSGLSEAVTKMAEGASKQASGSWEKLEGVFEDRVSRALRSMGVPTRNDLAALSAKIDGLQKSIEAMNGKGRTTAKATAKAPAKKAATTKAPAKTAAKKPSAGAAKGAAKTARAKSTAGTRRTARTPRTPGTGARAL